MRRHGGKSVFLVRFFYGLRFADAMTAGYLVMGFGRFFLFNLTGSFTWALTVGTAGYLFGQSLDLAVKGVKLAKIGLLLVIVGLLAIYFLSRKRKGKKPKGSF